MDKFLQETESDRETYFREAAQRMGGIAPVIVEKDFWVCWALDQLFKSELGTYLTFKGGTSLSKVYDVIRRFSEDIDLTIDRAYLKLEQKNDPEEPDITPTQRKKRLKRLGKTAQTVIKEQVLPLLQKQFGETLVDDFTLEVYDKDPDQQTILFFYPRVLKDESAYDGYVAGRVQLEFGVRGSPVPKSEHTVTPYVAEELPDMFEHKPQITVSALDIERNFWEKTTILHAMHYRPEDKTINKATARHYYDVAMMADHPAIVEKALKRADLLEDVVKNKWLFFYERSEWYGTANIGELKITPPDAMLEDIQRDYKAMRSMFFGSPPAFEDILASLQKLEKTINT